MASKYTFDNSGRVINRHSGLPPTKEEIAEGESAHAALMKADGAFQTALVKKYGVRAGDMRYMTEKLPPDLKKLSAAFQQATESWRETFEE